MHVWSIALCIFALFITTEASALFAAKHATTGSHPNDTCTWYYSENTRCRRQRTCFDCLNTKIEQECFLGIDGVCVTANDVPTTPKSIYFASNTTRYCSNHDAKCKRCQHSDVAVANHVCIGDNGCICLRSCESQPFASNCHDEESNHGNNTSVALSAASASRATVMHWLFVTLMVICIALPSMYKQVRAKWRLFHARRRRSLRNNQATATGNRRLELGGWHAMQQELIAKERMQPPTDYQHRIVVEPSSPLPSPRSHPFLLHW